MTDHREIRAIGLTLFAALLVVAPVQTESQESTVAFIERAGYDFTLLPDGDEVAKLSGVWGTPGLMIIDSERIIRFDLYTLPQLDLSAAGELPAHRKRAAYLAPYWAAELRKSLDLVLNQRAE